MRKSYGLIVNLSKPSALKTTRKIVQFLSKRHFSVWVEKEANVVLKLKGVQEGTRSQIFKNVSLVIALGGDGTILNVVRQMKNKKLPILGVNLGGLGFLAEVKTKELDRALQDLIKGKYVVETRMTLKTNVKRAGKWIASYDALNDVVVNNGELARAIHLKVSMDGEIVTSIICDGLIISTPTGSTAYSLSSGGPIVFPSTKAILMTPVSPHTLTNRPIVFPEDRVLKIKSVNPKDKVVLTVDGQIGLELKANDIVEVKKSNSFARLILLKKNTYFSILREKLSWGGIPSRKSVRA